MVENPDFSNEPWVSVRLTRREILRLFAATVGGVMLQAACGPLEQMTTREHRPIDPSLEIPSSYINDLEEVIAPLTKLMPPATAENLAIEVGKTSNEIHGHALVRNREIIILLPDASPEHMDFGKVIAFHEAARIFDQDDNTPCQYVKQQMKKRIGRNKYTPDEFKILTESSYCNISACRNLGHPEDGFDEVFASSITILRFYPFEFIEKLEGLRILNQNDFWQQMAWYVLMH